MPNGKIIEFKNNIYYNNMFKLLSTKSQTLNSFERIYTSVLSPSSPQITIDIGTSTASYNILFVYIATVYQQPSYYSPTSFGLDETTYIPLGYESSITQTVYAYASIVFISNISDIFSRFAAVTTLSQGAIIQSTYNNSNNIYIKFNLSSIFKNLTIDIYGM